MEKKNPLEEFRKEIQKSHSDGYIDDFTKLGISDEILDICDALDRFYGIYKTPQTSGDKIVDILNSTLTYTSYTSTIFKYPKEKYTKILLNSVPTLKNM